MRAGVSAKGIDMAPQSNADVKTLTIQISASMWDRLVEIGDQQDANIASLTVQILEKGLAEIASRGGRTVTKVA